MQIYGVPCIAARLANGGCWQLDAQWLHPAFYNPNLPAGHCPCCGGVTLAAIPTGLEDGSPFSMNIVALAIYLRFTHAISYRHLTQLLLNLYAHRPSIWVSDLYGAQQGHADLWQVCLAHQLCGNCSPWVTVRGMRSARRPM
jgi:hypothetical protein